MFILELGRVIMIFPNSFSISVIVFSSPLTDGGESGIDGSKASGETMLSSLFSKLSNSKFISIMSS